MPTEKKEIEQWHEKFKHLKTLANNEWFLCTSELIDAIKQVCPTTTLIL